MDGECERDNRIGKGCSEDERQGVNGRERDEGWETSIRIRREESEVDRGMHQGKACDEK